MMFRLVNVFKFRQDDEFGTKTNINSFICHKEVQMRTFLFSIILIASITVTSHAQNIYEKGGDIYLRSSNNTETQLTTSGHNSDPSLSPDGRLLVFVHATSKKPISAGVGDASPDELWVVNILNKKAEKIVDPKASEKMEEVFAGFQDSQFSEDSKYVFFKTQAWVTSGAIHRIE